MSGFDEINSSELKLDLSETVSFFNELMQN